MALVSDPNNIKLAMVGMVDGNGHPYSWSAIINGEYDREAMNQCGFPIICQYLAAAPKDQLGIPGACVTHIWCDNRADARKVADASLIPTVVDRPEDVIGQVDAVIIPTDKGWEHLDRARVFIEVGLPVFIDKPLADNEQDLQQFIQWQRQGKAIMSNSALRYSEDFSKAREHIDCLGDLRLITMTTCNSWERYGIHALEGVYPFLDSGGWLSVTNTGHNDANIVHITHKSGVDVVLAAISDMSGSFGVLSLYGTQDHCCVRFTDNFSAFRRQLIQFVGYLRSGTLPFSFDETVELVSIIIAGIRSREENGRKVFLAELRKDNVLNNAQI